MGSHLINDEEIHTLFCNTKFTKDDSDYQEVVYPEASFTEVKCNAESIHQLMKDHLNALDELKESYIQKKIQNTKRSIGNKQKQIERFLKNPTISIK